MPQSVQQKTNEATNWHQGNRIQLPSWSQEFQFKYHNVKNLPSPVSKEDRQELDEIRKSLRNDTQFWRLIKLGFSDAVSGVKSIWYTAEARVEDAKRLVQGTVENVKEGAKKFEQFHERLVQTNNENAERMGIKNPLKDKGNSSKK